MMEDNILRGPVVPLKESREDFGQIYLDKMDQYKDTVGLVAVDEGKKVTFAEMKENSIKLAIWLRMQKIVSKDDIVTLLSDARSEVSMFPLASIFNGVIYNPWSVVDLTLEFLQSVMSLTRPRIIFAISRAMDMVREACKIENHKPILVSIDQYPGLPSLDEILSSISQEEVNDFKVAKINDVDKDISMIFFTSGSTGLPKGVLHQYSSILNNFVMPWDERDPPRSLIYASPGWFTWTANFMFNLWYGGTYILCKKFDPIRTMQLVKEYHVNYFIVMPPEIVSLLRSGTLKHHGGLSGVKRYLTGACAINSDIFEKFKKFTDPSADYRWIYCSTEAVLPLTLNTGSKKRDNTIADPVGYVCNNVQLKIVDQKTGKILSSNQHGEILCKFPCMFLGYYKNSEDTKKTIDEDGWYHTGDLGYYDENGEVFIVERIKNLIKYKIVHVIPAVVENRLMKHPVVKEVVVVPVPDKFDGQRAMAFVVKTDEAGTEEELVEYSKALGEFSTLWGGVKFLDKLPVLPRGKIDRAVLTTMAKAYEQKYDESF